MTRHFGDLSYRRASENDLPFIREIEMVYALYGHSSLMMGVPSLMEMVLSFRSLHSAGMPYLVAVDSAMEAPGVVGFAYLLPSRDTFWPTGELRMWVHPQHCGRGAGSGLLERLKQLIIESRVSARFLHLAAPPGGPVLRNILAAQVLDPTGKEAGEAARRFFMNRGFRECGRLENVAYKNGLWVDVIYFLGWRSISWIRKTYPGFENHTMDSSTIQVQ